MDVVGALVGVDRLQVHDVADHVVLVGDAVAAVHVPRRAGDVQRLAAVVALEHGNVLHRKPILIEQAAHPEAALEAQGDLRLHVGELFLDQLVGRERAPELLPLERVGARCMPAEFRSPHGTPGDAVAGAVKATEGTGQAFDVGQQVLLGNQNVVEHDFARDRSPQAHLSLDFRGAEPVEPALNDEAADDAVEFCPNHGEIGDGRVGDPHLRTVEPVAARNGLRPGDHAAGIRSVIGFRQPETADPFATRQLRQVALALILIAVGVNGVHDQRGLDAHGRPVPRIHPFDLPGHKPVGDVVDGGTAVLCRQGGAQQAKRAHLVHDFPVEVLVAVRIENARHQLTLRVFTRRVTDHAFVFGELVL